MELGKCKEKTRCEMGGCKQKADYTIRLSRAGIRSTINVCSECLKELYRLLGGELVPKSIETIRKNKEE